MAWVGLTLACGGKARTNNPPDTTTDSETTETTDTTTVETKECAPGTWRPYLQEEVECKPHTVCTTSASIAGTATSDTFCFNGWIKQWPADGFRPEDASITGSSLLIAGSKGTEFGSAEVKTVVQEIDLKSGEMLGAVEHPSTGTPGKFHMALLHEDQLVTVVDRETESEETEADLARWERWDAEPVWKKTVVNSIWENSLWHDYPWWPVSFQGDGELFVAMSDGASRRIESYSTENEPVWSAAPAGFGRLAGMRTVLLDVDVTQMTARSKENGEELWAAAIPQGEVEDPSTPWIDSLAERNGELYLLGRRAEGPEVNGHLFIAKLSAATGELRWVHEWLPMPSFFWPAPAFGCRLVLGGDDTLYTSFATYEPLTEFGHAAPMDVFFRKLSAETGETLWTKQLGTTGVDMVVSLLLEDDALFITGTTEGKLASDAVEGDGVFVMRFDL